MGGLTTVSAGCNEAADSTASSEGRGLGRLMGKKCPDSDGQWSSTFPVPRLYPQYPVKNGQGLSGTRVLGLNSRGLVILKL